MQRRGSPGRSGKAPSRNRRTGRATARGKRPPTLRVATGPQPTIPRYRFAVTRRAAILGVVICLLVITLAYPLRAYLSQRSEIQGLVASNSAAEQRVGQLKQTIADYADPAFIESQARQRLYYQRPGDQVWQQPSAKPAPLKRETAGHATVTVEPGTSWYDQLWSSSVQAGR
jgi:cell division protein FtsB